MRSNTRDDFWRFVNKTPTCWLWTGAVSSYRYGKFCFGGRKHKAHRFSWELANGPIPDGLHVLHRCDNGFCVRPDHLFVGTHQDNMTDKKRKGRVVVARGTANHLARISENVVHAIRADYALGIRQVDIDARYGIDQTHVSRIVLRKCWAHV